MASSFIGVFSALGSSKEVALSSAVVVKVCNVLAQPMERTVGVSVYVGVEALQADTQLR